MTVEHLDTDIYTRCLSVAKSYYQMIRRQKEIEDDILCASICSDGQPHGTGVSDPTARKAERIVLRQEENARKIVAVEQAWSLMTEDGGREFIKKNLFEHIPMQHINLALSIIAMKRVRKKFMIALAMNLHEI